MRNVSVGLGGSRPVSISLAWRDTRRRLVGSAVVALLAATVFVYPVIHAAWVGAEIVTFANESVAYRFGHVHRLAMGDESAIWLPQGYTLGLAQRGIYAAVSASVVDQDLHLAIGRFGRATGAAVALFVLATVLAMGQDARLSPWSKLWALLTLVISVYGFTTAGAGYAISSDYYQLDVAFGGAAVYLFLAGMARLDRPPRVVDALRMSVFVGLVAANKISMLPLASLVLVPLALRAWPRWSVVVGVSALCAAVVPITFVAVHAAYYGFDLGALVRVYPRWLVYVGSGSGEAGFWEHTFEQQMRGYNYRYAALFAVAAFAIAATSLAVWWLRLRGRRSWLALGVARGSHRELLAAALATGWITVVAAAAVGSLYRRPAATTLFEVACIAVALGAALLGLVVRVRIGRVGGAALAVAWIAVIVTSFHAPWLDGMLRESASRGARSWEIHRHLVSYGKPVIAVIEDDGYASNSVEKLLLKAFSDFPSWSIGAGRDGLRRVAPIDFRTRYTAESPDLAYPSGFVLAHYVRVDLEADATPAPALVELRSRPGVVCRRWPIDAWNAADVCDVP